MTGTVLRAMERVARVGVWLGGGALIALSFVVTIEVVLRKVFLIGLSAATELSAYALAVGTAWAYSFALLQRSHVRVDAVVRLLPKRAVVWIDLLAHASLTWFAGMLLWHGYGAFQASVDLRARAMTPLGTPLWIPQGLWVLGLLVFLVTCLAVLAHALRLLAAGRTAEVNGLIGTFSSQEEAVSEAAQAAARQARRHADGRPSP
ncbi:MAG TPA: TRAP transporter small permease [Geminicoccaceae bacterium]|nr:TRAP transporter small permease [Geminicoccaceae bacterium]